MLGVVSGTQWLIGWIVAGAVVLVVVLLLGTIIYLAANIRRQLLDVHAALRDARDNTAPLWHLQSVNELADDILGEARQAREALGG